MPKKFLIITATQNSRPFAGLPHEASLQQGLSRLQADLQDTSCFVAAVNELVITVLDSQVTIRDTRNDCDLSEYDFVQFINVSFARDHFHAIALYLRHHNIGFIDPHGTRGTTLGKTSQMVHFALQGIAVPDTMAVWGMPLYAQQAPSVMQMPCICKLNQGTKGNDNFLVKTWEELATLLAERGSEGFVLQPFIPNDGDYRVLYIGGQSVVFYRQAQAGSHLNNTSQNGSGTLVSAEDCPPAVAALAARAREAYGSAIAGVDVLVDRETDTPYILEVNDTPAIFSGLFQQEKGVLYAHYIQQQLDNRG